VAVLLQRSPVAEGRFFLPGYMTSVGNKKAKAGTFAFLFQEKNGY
jgi:hypothetical protein